MALQPYSFEPTINDIDSNFNPMHFANEILNTNLCIENKSIKPVNEWCLCEKCLNLSTDRECVCCIEFENLQKLCLDKKCITLNKSFSKIILDEEILNITRQQMIVKTKNRKKRNNLCILDNKIWRFICYKQFTHWVNSWSKLGKGW